MLSITRLSSPDVVWGSGATNEETAVQADAGRLSHVVPDIDSTGGSRSLIRGQEVHSQIIGVLT